MSKHVACILKRKIYINGFGGNGQGPLRHLNVGPAVSVQAFTGVSSYTSLFRDIRRMTMVSLLSLPTGRLYHQEILLVLSSVGG